MLANLVVRNEEDMALALKQLAAHDRSTEAELREIPHAALQKPKRHSLAEVLANMPEVGFNSDFDFRNSKN